MVRTQNAAGLKYIDTQLLPCTRGRTCVRTMVLHRYCEEATASGFDAEDGGGGFSYWYYYYYYECVVVRCSDLLMMMLMSE